MFEHSILAAADKLEHPMDPLTPSVLPGLWVPMPTLFVTAFTNKVPESMFTLPDPVMDPVATRCDAEMEPVKVLSPPIPVWLVDVFTNPPILVGIVPDAILDAFIPEIPSP